jgi:hypothetical protein
MRMAPLLDILLYFAFEQEVLLLARRKIDHRGGDLSKRSYRLPRDVIKHLVTS